LRRTSNEVSIGSMNVELRSAFASVLDELRAKREAAYFEVGVEYGIAATRATKLAGGRKTVNALAQRVVRELMRTGVARDDMVGALVVAAWAVIGARSRPRALD
jgi:hypothetical protein